MMDLVSARFRNGICTIWNNLFNLLILYSPFFYAKRNMWITEVILFRRILIIKYCSTYHFSVYYTFLNIKNQIKFFLKYNILKYIFLWKAKKIIALLYCTLLEWRNISRTPPLCITKRNKKRNPKMVIYNVPESIFKAKL